MPTWADLSTEIVGGLIASGIIAIGALLLGYLKRFQPDWRGWDWPAIADAAYYTLKCAAVAVATVSIATMALAYHAISTNLRSKPALAFGAGVVASTVPATAAAETGAPPWEVINHWLDQLELTRNTTEPPPGGELMRVSFKFENELTNLSLGEDATTIKIEKIFSLSKEQEDWWNSIPRDVKDTAIWSVAADVLTSGVRVRWAPKEGHPVLVIQKKLDLASLNRMRLQAELELISDAGRIAITRFHQAFVADASVRFPQLVKDR